MIGNLFPPEIETDSSNVLQLLENNYSNIVTKYMYLLKKLGMQYLNIISKTTTNCQTFCGSKEPSTTPELY